MKRFAITTLLFGALAIVFSAQPTTAQVNVSVTIGGFYDELSPYGSWVDCSYGQCWVPERVDADWQPYTNGQWVYTDYGWTWMSNDPWGGNPYHYGTWTRVDRYGWAWVPGTVWAPAWVTWSYGNNYVGWAPLPPTVVFDGSGYAGRAVVVESTQYVFVPMNRFAGTSVTSVRVSAQQSATIFRQTTPVTSFAVSGGIVRNTAIPVETIQRATGAKIETRSISAANTTPRSMSAGIVGKSQRVAIVAPAHEVRAAVAARPQAASRSAAPSVERGGKAQVNQESRSAGPESRQGSTVQRAPVKPAQQEQRAPKAQAASPGESRSQAAQAPSQPRQESSNAPRRPVASQSEPRREAATAQHQGSPARTEAAPRAEANPAPAARSAQTQQSREQAKPAETAKDKKPAERNKDQKPSEKGKEEKTS